MIVELVRLPVRLPEAFDVRHWIVTVGSGAACHPRGSPPAALSQSAALSGGRAALHREGATNCHVQERPGQYLSLAASMSALAALAASWRRWRIFSARASAVCPHFGVRPPRSIILHGRGTRGIQVHFP